MRSRDTRPRCNAPIRRWGRIVRCRRAVSEPGRRCWSHGMVGAA